MTESRSPATTHLPVLRTEVTQRLITNLSGTYLDCTFGLGGHTSALAEGLNDDAILVGIDQDRTALRTFDPNRLQQKLHLVHTNFEFMDEALQELGIPEADGILMDLGLNSFSLDDAERGFSFSLEGPLDMRFDASGGHHTAADVVNGYSEKQLADIIWQFGEERKSRKIAHRIVTQRRETPFRTTLQLRQLIESCVHPATSVKSLARVFQALRIEVNRELEVLRKGLEKAIILLKIGGRLAVISYHSLEDRMVKRTFRDLAESVPEQPGMHPDEIKIPTLELVNRKPITADRDEIERNPRSRSAKLRVVEKLRHAA